MDAGIAAIISAVAVIATAGGTFLGKWLETRVAQHAGDSGAQDKLIDQLQEELTRYRERTDERLDNLEAENRGYRAFIGIQRDHMAAHNIPLPPWPEGLPR